MGGGGREVKGRCWLLALRWCGMHGDERLVWVWWDCAARVRGVVWLRGRMSRGGSTVGRVDWECEPYECHEYCRWSCHCILWLSSVVLSRVPAACAQLHACTLAAELRGDLLEGRDMLDPISNMYPPSYIVLRSTGRRSCWPVRTLICKYPPSCTYPRVHHSPTLAPVSIHHPCLLYTSPSPRD